MTFGFRTRYEKEYAKDASESDCVRSAKSAGYLLVEEARRGGLRTRLARAKTGAGEDAFGGVFPQQQ